MKGEDLAFFVGYPHEQKGYEVYDISDKRIYTLWDVKLFENIFPYRSQVDKVREMRDKIWETFLECDDQLYTIT